jgi:AraC-like DNA-binding protein
MESDPAVELSELASMVNLSVSRLRHLFKVETGTTPTKYLKEWRLRRAAELLRTTFLTVKEIVRQLGLASGSHFVGDFKQIYGMSPSEYRLRNRPVANKDQNRKK